MSLRTSQAIAHVVPAVLHIEGARGTGELAHVDRACRTVVALSTGDGSRGALGTVVACGAGRAIRHLLGSVGPSVSACGTRNLADSSDSQSRDVVAVVAGRTVRHRGAGAACRTKLACWTLTAYIGSIRRVRARRTFPRLYMRRRTIRSSRTGSA